MVIKAISIMVKNVHATYICEKCLWERILKKKLEINPIALEDFEFCNKKPWWRFWVNSHPHKKEIREYLDREFYGAIL